MRRVVQLLLLLSVISCLYACKKDKINQAKIVGTWELRFAFDGGLTQTYTSGNGNTYTFGADNTFSQNQGATVVNHGTYSIKGNAIQVNDIAYNELLLNGASTGQVIQVQDTTLSLGLEYNNGSGGVYAKIK